MLEQFSQRTIQSLKQQTLFRLILGPLQRFLESNVNKEVEKDRQTILLAASLVRDEKYPTQQDVQRLLDLARDIDQAFLHEAVIFSGKVTIHYQEIEPIRQQRIQCLLNETHQLLRQWQTMSCLRNALAVLYEPEQYQKLVYDILHLYCLETKALSHAIRLPALLSFASESLTQTIYVAMEAEARQLSAELVGRLYRHPV